MLLSPLPNPHPQGRTGPRRSSSGAPSAVEAWSPALTAVQKTDENPWRGVGLGHGQLSSAHHAHVWSPRLHG